MPSRFTIVGLGEALWDVYPDQQQMLGGATLDLAIHAHQLAQPRAGRGVIASRVGQDDLGRQMIQELAARGMDTQYLQSDPDAPTGQVFVGFDAQGQPGYQISNNTAWDMLHFDPDIEDLARRCEAVCFGSLAQRNGQARTTIYRFLTAAARAERLFDVNLREHYYDAAIFRRSCELSTAVKLNDQELPVLAQALGISPPAADGSDPQDAVAAALLRKFSLRMVVLTRGNRGTVIHTAAGRFEGPPVSYPAISEAGSLPADPVGAGDACAAAILLGLVLRFPTDRIVNLANHAGAFVASQPGATPRFPESILKMFS